MEKEKSKEEPLVERVLAAYKSSRLSGWQEDFLSRLVSESSHPFDISGCVVPRLVPLVTVWHTHLHTHPHTLGTAGTADCSAARV